VPLKELYQEQFFPNIFWENPNIQPYTEYRLRRDSLREFTAAENLLLLEGSDYNITDWLPPAQEASNRCEFCLRQRLQATALRAVEEKIDIFTTTMLYSQYLDHTFIKTEGELIAARMEIQFWYRDWRPSFQEGQKQARQQGLYRQKYCGCIFSEEERFHKN